MIKYSLKCNKDHVFEAWFSVSSSFEKQNKKKLISCPSCGSLRIEKSIMAPNISPKGQSSKESIQKKIMLRFFLIRLVKTLKLTLIMLVINLLMKQDQCITAKKMKEKFMEKRLLRMLLS